MNEILTGNNVEIMRSLPNDSIDLTVTSPPYDKLRNYNGYSFDFELVSSELFRVTKDSGVVVWIVGDSTVKGSETSTPFEQALHFKSIGFNLLDTMIYEKAGGGARGSSYCYTQAFEYMFIFTKGRNATFNPIFKENVTKRNIDTTASRKADGTVVTRSIKYKETSKRNNIWRYTNAYGHSTKDLYAHNHPAIFPEKLAEDHILTWSNEGDVVLDPFGGSGTTAKMAAMNNRNYIHIDISEEYNEIARKRLEGAIPSE